MLGIVSFGLALAGVVFGGAAWHHVSEIERDLEKEAKEIREERTVELERLRVDLDYQRLLLDTYETWMHNTRERMIAAGIATAPIPAVPPEKED